MRNLLLLASLLLALFHPGAALAHPHIIAKASFRLVFGPDGALVALACKWTYDSFYSSFAKRLIDTDNDGKYSPAEVAQFVQKQTASLNAVRFFTSMEADGADVKFASAEMPQLSLSSDVDELTYEFTLPLEKPTTADRFRIQVYDPDFFAYFTLADQSHVVEAKGKTGSCRSETRGPSPIDLRQPKTVPSALWAALDGVAAAKSNFVNEVIVKCQ